MGIGTVAIYSDPDRDAPFVRAADEAVYIGPPMASASFLAVEKLVEIARRTGADAVHPGYGFLSENAEFAVACAAAEIVFIGPPPEVIRRSSELITAKEIMAAAGVPVVPGFTVGGLSARELADRAATLGYPVLVKASAGGGGKGMRIVQNPDRLPAALEAARREAAAAFGDDALLIERYVDRPRHVEVQILGDTHGTILHCFERECSIQRRHQKIIEEAPSPALDGNLRARLCSTAVAAGRAIGYVNAGTVEFVLDAAGAFHFLEVNTRLQVEHPVTEATTGLDLVRLQILVAEGAPLPLRQEDIVVRGHAIECRLYAEDPRNGYLPSTGSIACWHEGGGPGVRWDSGVTTGSEVTIHYDPMLAKVIAHAPTRAEAARRLARALEQSRILGVRTNQELLTRVLRDPVFLSGDLDTHFLERHPDLGTAPSPLATARVHALAAALWAQAERRRAAPLQRSIPSGWRNNPSQLQTTKFTHDGEVITVGYRVGGGGSVHAEVDGEAYEGTLVAATPGAVDVVLGATRRTYHVARVDDLVGVWSALGHSALTSVPRFPPPTRDEIRGGCLAPMPGKVLALRVAPGDRVARGSVLAILEAMKMEHEVTAPADGIVRAVPVEAGQQVDAGTVLVVLEEESA